MNKIILSLAAAAALAGAGGAFAQSAGCRAGLPDGTGVCNRVYGNGGNVPYVRPGEEQNLLGLTYNGERYVYREPDRGPYAYYENDRRWSDAQRRIDRERDRDGIRNQRDRDRDGDGVRNSRDSHPDNPRRH